MARRKQKQATQSDGAYLLKIVLFILAGSTWLRFADPLTIGALTFSGIPLGLMIGLLFATHDHFQVDRKIEYVVLIMATIISYFLPTGILL